EAQGTATCPAGHTVALSRTRVAAFGALCRDCPLHEQCTTCKAGRKLVLHQRDDLLRAARADWAATERRKDYIAYRPNVERAIAQVATWRGRRLKLRYRGTASNHAWLKRRTAALTCAT
ncbi:MAG TPA: transposase, partial [Streptosporangiaceae bacterium]|nr:transposase [Streptosporangiaceae bacterium]